MLYAVVMPIVSRMAKGPSCAPVASIRALESAIQQTCLENFSRSDILFGDLKHKHKERNQLAKSILQAYNAMAPGVVLVRITEDELQASVTQQSSAKTNELDTLSRANAAAAFGSVHEARELRVQCLRMAALVDLLCKRHCWMIDMMTAVGTALLAAALFGITVQASKRDGYHYAVSLETHWRGAGSAEESTRQSWAGMKNKLQSAGALQG